MLGLLLISRNHICIHHLDRTIINRYANYSLTHRSNGDILHEDGYIHGGHTANQSFASVGRTYHMWLSHIMHFQQLPNFFPDAEKEVGHAASLQQLCRALQELLSSFEDLKLQ